MPPAQRKEKILVIEGNRAFGDQIVAALSARGYGTVLAGTAADGMNALLNGIPHLLVIGANLPDNASYALLTEKQSEPLLQKIPVFLMSTKMAPINMSLVPPGSVTEFLMMLDMNVAGVAAKVDQLFGYPTDQGVAATGAQPSAEAGMKKKVLWVEDDKLIGAILSKKLTTSGFDLFHAKNGDEALETMRQVVPDVIVLDLVLPNMSGFDILKAVRDDQRLAAVPVMILSNLSKQSDIERAKALGAQKFLVKAAASLDQIVQEIRGMCR